MRRHIARGLIAAWLAVALVACTVRFVADYDQVGFEELLATAKQVDLFYGKLLEQPEAQRRYAHYSDRYVAIESDIRALWLRNAARDDNRDSEQIIHAILDEWARYRERHQQRDAYSTANATLDRDRLAGMFRDAASAEAAKQRDN